MTTANHVLLRRITLTAEASSVTFDSIPQTGYTDLKLQYSARGTATPAYLYEHIRMTFNGGSSGDYRSRMLYGNGSAAYSADGSGPGSTVAPWAGVFNANNTTSNTFSSCETYITNYAIAGVEKSFSTDAVTENNATGAAATLTAQRWTGTAAITSITLAASTGNFMVGSSFSLYGIADVNTTPTAAPKADGGDIIRTDGTYWYHEFYSAGVFKPQLNLSCDYLVIAGGGGGGGGYGAGGGAGGYLTASNYSMSATSYPVTVGSGGAGGSSTNGVAGTNSTLGSIIAYGGGFGAGPNTPGSRPGGPGGSGGGAGYASGTAGAATPSGQGYPGGTGPAGFYGGAGGGGAGGPGQVGASQANCVGGAGLSSSITGTAVTRASGGSGYSAAATTGGGGSGNGGTIHGTAYTGGGGGTENNGPTASGGNGGSGIVIIRYTVA